MTYNHESSNTEDIKEKNQKKYFQRTLINYFKIGKSPSLKLQKILT